MGTMKNLLKSGLVGTAMILSSCATDKNYRFDLSGLNPWQADLFLEAGRAWGMDISRDDSSRNKAYLGNVPEEFVAYTRIDRKRPLEAPNEKIYTFTVAFKPDKHWVNCLVKGSYGEDFGNVARHEAGHIYYEKGDEIHTSFPNPDSIMHFPAPQRCP